MIEALQKLLAIESIACHGEGGTHYGIGPEKALTYVLELCDSLGFRTKNADGRYGYAEIGNGKELIGILAHLDVVPAGEGWDYPPFEGTIDGDQIYGRGVIDDKGPAIASIYAMKELLDSGMPLNKRIRLILGQSEENGDWFDIEAYKAEEELPDYGFTPDGDFPAIYGEKGIMLVKLSMDKEQSGFTSISAGSAPNMVPEHCKAEVTDCNGDMLSFETTGKAAHGSAPWAGENAIAKMMEKITDDDGFDAPLATAYMELIGFDVYGEKLGCKCEDKESGQLSVNNGMIKMEEDKVCIYLDIRYPVTYNCDDIFSIISIKGESYGLSADFVHHMRPVYEDKDGPLMNTLLSAYREVTGDMAEPMVIGGATYARSMDNIIAFGPNIPGHEVTEHEKNEYILLEDLETIRKVYRIALEKLVNESRI